MSKLIIIRGKVNAGKTTTAGLLYEKILSQMNSSKHSFNGKEVNEDSLKYIKRTGNLQDFATTLVIDGKIISIISAGDVADSLDEQLKFHIPFADFIICCSRSANRKGSSYLMIKDKYEKNNPIILEQLVSKDKSIYATIAKKDAVDNIFKAIISTPK